MNPISETKVLDHGILALESYWGDDLRPARIARTSFRNSDAEKTDAQNKGLIKYLVDHHHDTPLEFCGATFYCVMPIFVARQWVRHRAACLSGDTVLSFDLPSGPRRSRRKYYELTVKQVFDRFKPSSNKRPDKQGNPFHKRDRLKSMMMRSVNEQTMQLTHTSIEGIWSTGVREVLRVEFSGGFIRATGDHLCLTDAGWMRLIDALEQGVKFASVGRAKASYDDLPISDEEIAREEWRWVIGYEGKYKVSSMGRVMSFATTAYTGRTSEFGVIKKLTTSKSGYSIVSLSNKGKSRARFVHHLALEAFCGPRQDGLEARHLDGVRTNNRVQNLAWGTSRENSADRMGLNGSQRLGVNWEAPRKWSVDGEEEVFDIEVSGPYHNFIAGSVAVHNSINEESLRYVDARQEVYIPAPERCQKQSEDNKQGSSPEIVDAPELVRLLIQKNAEECFHNYELLMSQGLAKEIARSVLPLGLYTGWYWQANLRMILHFLSLRTDPHAQYEIRVYAEAMLEQLRPIFPTIIRAWEGE